MTFTLFLILFENISLFWCKNVPCTRHGTLLITEKIYVTIRDFKKASFRRIFVWRISFARMTHFAGECFLLNPHMKQMKLGLFVKPQCFKEKVNYNKKR